MRRDTLRRAYPLLKYLAKVPSKHRPAAMRYITHDGCDAIKEAVSNTITNKSLSVEERKRIQETLLPYKRHYKLLLKEPDPARRKRTLVRLGSSLDIVFSTALPIIKSYTKADDSSDGGDDDDDVRQSVHQSAQSSSSTGQLPATVVAGGGESPPLQQQQHQHLQQYYQQSQQEQEQQQQQYYDPSQ